jgi:hypothetical protein
MGTRSSFRSPEPELSGVVVNRLILGFRAEFTQKTPRVPPRGRRSRRSLLVGSVVIGCLSGGLMLGPTSSYGSHHQFRFKDGVSEAHYHLGAWP